MITPPAASKIRVDTDWADGYVRRILSTAKAGVVRFAISIFLLCWLVGWAAGWIAAFRQLTSGGKAPEPFLILWLAAWTIGGAFAFSYLRRLLRPTVPETLVLARSSLIYDTGVQPVSFGYRGKD